MTTLFLFTGFERLFKTQEKGKERVSFTLDRRIYATSMKADQQRLVRKIGFYPRSMVCLRSGGNAAEAEDIWLLTDQMNNVKSVLLFVDINLT